MQREAAKKLIRDTFERPFDRNQFVKFTKNLLNRIEDAQFTYRGNLIFDDFKDQVHSLERIGKYQDADGNKIDILIVQLVRETTLERARSSQRQFVAKYLKGSRGGELKDAALVAFVSPDEQDWRFSFVKMEYRLDQQRGKVIEEFTPARRYSFLVGKNENSHTAQSRLLPILEDTDRNPTLNGLQEAFSVEKVTREFFEQCRNLFLDIKESLDSLVRDDEYLRADFEKQGVETIDFAKKLLGQIVFLYFLQKKGWFGVGKRNEWGSGPKRFLRELNQKRHGDYKNFFNDTLEPLFYSTLAVERPGDYSDKFDCRIPFLNGGLFDPLCDYDWQRTDVLLPNELFSNTIKTKQGDTGTGILDVFDRYNFTVKEDEPLEKEVAVDPEMLGKVFENLLEVKDRRSKGTYYTPREIVHFMCQQSLVNYLASEFDGKVSRDDIEQLVKVGEATVEHDTRVVSEGRETRTYAYKLSPDVRDNAKFIDAKLVSIRVCDPAVGSGAFPVGMMNEIVRARSALTPYLGDDNERTSYNFKRHAIQHCLYGVDIDAGAVEIAKLRLWLSLIVDEEKREDIQPLPNLDYKIVQGNSLVSVEKNLLNMLQFNQLEELKPLYFNETSGTKKQKYKRQIDQIISQITKGHRDFDFEIYFSEVFHEKKGFDVVIANPPYISVEKFTRTTLQAEWKRRFKTFAARGDIYCFFYERGLTLLHEGGVLTFISSNKFQRAGYGRSLRELLTSYNIRTLIDFCELPVFAAGTDPMIVIVQKVAMKADTEFPVLVVKEEVEIGSLEQALASRSFRYKPSELKVDGWSLEGSHGLKLVEKIRSKGTPLGRYVNNRFYYGIKTGLNEAFVIDKVTRDLLIKEDHKSAELIEPWIRGVDIKRWNHDWSELYLIQIASSENARHPWSEKGASSALELFKKTYPAIATHLLRYQRQLKERTDQGTYFWELRSCDYWAAFDEPKIVFNETSKRLHAYYDTEGNTINKTGFIILASDAPYVLTVLNSSVLDWLYRSTFPSWGDPWKEGRIQFRGNLMEQVPIPDANATDRNRLRMLAERATKLVAARKADELSKVDQEIDEIVFRLFDLTPEEIEIVERGQ